MNYLAFVELYEQLAATKKHLEKVQLLAVFLRMLEQKGKGEWVYLLRGRVIPEYDSREFGISRQLVIQAIHQAYGISEEKIVALLNKKGDLGEATFHFSEQRKQAALFTKTLSVEHVFSSLVKLFGISGKGSVETKLSLISELLLSAQPREALYLVRTLLNDLRVGVADALLCDALAEAFFPGDPTALETIADAYDLANDFALVLHAAAQGKQALAKITLVPGKPLKVMLPVKVTSLQEAFDICGRPAALEHKYDGFRVLIHKQGKNVFLFTRKLENVTKQFPDVVAAVLAGIRGESFILDSEVVGYDPRTFKHLPFEAVSQRIKRKHDIDSLRKTLPVEIHVFDVLYHEGTNVMHLPFSQRRVLLERIVQMKEHVLRPSVQIVTDSDAVAEQFYKKALAGGEEGIMMKKIDAVYRAGRRVGFIVKFKPLVADLDVVIVSAEYGTGKRGGWLTSYRIACRDGTELVELGNVSSGLKEKEEEGMTYEQMTALLKPLILSRSGESVRVSPQIVLSVTYQNIQPSPSMSSGYALRFPRVTAYRPDKSVEEIATLADLEREVQRQQRTSS